ncbi:helix-turn-helix domain-containing protein [Tumebacillus lipolyticus]|uniref:Helix-turn-helix domain-containing protein n=1 Tax=Tumebacillus lipolyticus TaxID=1280370 RepID=A0ABW5A2R5_9BACL
MDVKAVLQALSDKGITNSEQMVRRWIRSGELKGARSANRKAGYQVDPADLDAFIQQRSSSSNHEIHRLQTENEALLKRVAELERELAALRVPPSSQPYTTMIDGGRYVFLKHPNHKRHHVYDQQAGKTVCGKSIDDTWHLLLPNAYTGWGVLSAPRCDGDRCPTCIRHTMVEHDL